MSSRRDHHSSSRRKSRSRSPDQRSRHHRSSRHDRVERSHRDDRRDDRRSDRDYFDRPSDRRDTHHRSNRDQDRHRPKRDSRQAFRFDSPPKDEELTKPGLVQALQSINTITQQDGGGNILTSIQAMAKAQTDKIDRKLYVGNIPAGITQQLLLNIMNEAILSLGVIKEPGNPILSAWISSDSHYAFVEFRNADEANLGFQLQGMNISGSEIKLGRPKSYESTMQQIGLAASLTSLSTTTTLSGIRGSLPEQYHALDDPTTQGTRLGGTQSQVQQMPLPSRVMVLKGIVDFESVYRKEGFQEIYSDLWDECSLFGPVISIKIPKPVFVDRSAENAKIDAQTLAQEAVLEDRKAAADPRYIKQSERRKAKMQKDLQELDIMSDKRNYDLPIGFGNVYVKFLTINSCNQAVKELDRVMYGQNQCETFWHLEDHYDRGEFGPLPAVQQTEMGQQFEGLTNLPIEFLENRESAPIQTN